MSPDDAVLVEHRGDALHVTLNRPAHDCHD